MIEEKQTIKILQTYGLNVQCLSQRSLQKKIVEIYEILEQKTTQNLLLKKQNDDIRLQIDTINELFAEVSPDIHLNLRQNLIVLPKQTYADSNQSSSKKIKKNDSERLNKVICYQKDSISDRLSDRLINKPNCNKFQKQTEQSIYQSVGTEEKTPRYSSNFSQSGGLNEKILNNQQTKRGVTVQSIKKQQKSVEEKMQFLIQQNQLILKRMNQIEARFNKTNEQQIRNQVFKKQIDDKLTNYSSNTPSIKKSQNIQEKSLNHKHLISQARSTANLRSYRQSIA